MRHLGIPVSCFVVLIARCTVIGAAVATRVGGPHFYCLLARPQCAPGNETIRVIVPRWWSSVWVRRSHARSIID